MVLLHISSLNKNRNYIAIGDGSLISRRDDFVMPNGKRLGEYIPFYFGPRMPMLYVIQKGFNSVTPPLPAEIVYCITSVQAIQETGLNYAFSNGHAVDRFTEFYYQEDIKEILNIIDMKAINEKYWKVENDLDFKRRKEAEFLVEGDIPIGAIQIFAVYNRAAAIQLKKMTGYLNQSVIVKANYYF